MNIENLLRNNINRRNVFGLVGFGLPLLILSCGKQTVTGNVDISGDIDIGEKKEGMIEGKVTIPRIENNKPIYVGVAEAIIEIAETTFKTQSVSGGFYAIDGIPTGSYNIKGKSGAFGSKSYGYKSDTQSVIVRRQETSVVPDLELTPAGMDSNRDDNCIFYGKLYDTNKTTPFSNKKINYYSVAWKASNPGVYIPGTYQGSLTTSSDGAFAFYTMGELNVLTYNGRGIHFFNTNSLIPAPYGYSYPMLETDGYLNS